MNCDDVFRRRLVERLAGFTLLETELGEARAAAVAVTVVDAGLGAGCNGLPVHRDWRTDAALVLTRRSSRLRRHAGQWAFPGGRVDPGETPEQTALREMHEEIGLALGPTRILGRLDDFVTRSGYVMTPVVIWGGPQPTFQPNPDEVDSVHRIPVAELLREDAPLLDHVADDAPPVLRMPIGEDWIAAPTAAILYQFREVCMLGRDTRVAHYDQPRFAWR
ncbi:MAG: CoA pyrophosphatase [Gammaproteobacteria bacterium]